MASKFIKKFIDSIKKYIKKYGLVFALGFFVAILSFVFTNAVMKPLSTPKFCTVCHEMDEAYNSWELSSHGRNSTIMATDCSICHLPPKEKYFRYLVAKSYVGIRDVFKHFFVKYDVEEMRLTVLDKMPNSRCLYCHNNLLNKSSSVGAMIAHKETLFPAEGDTPKCVQCHSSIHEREKKIFSSD